MKHNIPALAKGLLLLCSVGLLHASPSTPAGEKSVIAHRGASAYLPEHTLEAYALAYGMGAHYIEPDLMLTRDGVPIALHDRTLDATTDVASRFPDRAREDGRFYALDFDLAEIKELRVLERIDSESSARVYPERWDNRQEAIHFRIPALVEVIELVQGLNRSTGRNVGIYPEIKSSEWHARSGHDFEAIVLAIVSKYGYKTKGDPIIIQSFEETSLRRLRELGCELRLVQLIGGGRAFDPYVTVEGLDHIATFADGIGPAQTRILGADGLLIEDNFLVREAHKRGLVVHPYTVRADALPAGVETLPPLLEKLFLTAGVDGLFTDHPDLVLQWLEAHRDTAISKD